MSGTDLIDRAIQDPEKEMEIIQATVNRIKSMWGGTETTMGYFAMKQFVNNMIPPKQRDAYMKAFTENADVSSIISGKTDLSKKDLESNANKDIWTQQATGQLGELTKITKDIFNWMKEKIC